MAAISAKVIQQWKVGSGGGALECLGEVNSGRLCEDEGIEQDIARDFEYSCLANNIVSL